MLRFLYLKVSHQVLIGSSMEPVRLLCPWNSPGQHTGVGCHSLLQAIFPTQGSNWGLSHCRQILYHLSHQGSPRILEWVAYPFFSGSSWPRNLTGVCCTAGRLFTSWDTKEALILKSQPPSPYWKLHVHGLSKDGHPHRMPGSCLGPPVPTTLSPDSVLPASWIQKREWRQGSVMVKLYTGI